MSTSPQMFNFNNTSGSGGGSGSGQMFNFGSQSGVPTSGTAGFGSNQYMSYPSMPNTTPQTSGALPSPNAGTNIPGIVPQANSPDVGTPGGHPGTGGTGGPTGAWAGTGPTTTGTGTGQYQVGTTMDPALTSQFNNWLQQQIGTGMTPFNLSALLPSSGDATTPGSLTAPNNEVLQQLMKSFTDPNGIMAQMQKTGMPIDQTPAWQAMKEAMQRTIGEGAANLKEGMNVGGNLVGSPYGTAAADYQDQAAKDLNAQLLQAQTAAQEAARQRQLGAAGTATAFGSGMQGLDQASIDRMYQEFQRTQPQNNPLIGTIATQANQQPQYLKTKDTMDQITQMMNAISGMFAGSSATTSGGSTVAIGGGPK